MMLFAGLLRRFNIADILGANFRLMILVFIAIYRKLIVALDDLVFQWHGRQYFSSSSSDMALIVSVKKAYDLFS
jgi:hypothetical protein